MAETGLSVYTRQMVDTELNDTFPTKWDRNYAALVQYVEREGSLKAPTIHREMVNGVGVPLSSWSASQRRNHKEGGLSASRAKLLESVPGWEWGPLKPGPVGHLSRNDEMCSLRAEGMALSEIGRRYGVSRQRVHQITLTSSSAL